MQICGPTQDKNIKLQSGNRNEKMERFYNEDLQWLITAGKQVSIYLAYRFPISHHRLKRIVGEPIVRAP